MARTAPPTSADAQLVADVLREFADGAPEEHAAAMERVANRLDANLAAASTLGDDFLDASGPSVHLPRIVATTLLEARGWRIEDVGHGDFAYVMPGGRLRGDGGSFGNDFLWEFDEAVRTALIAEALPDLP